MGRFKKSRFQIAKISLVGKTRFLTISSKTYILTFFPGFTYQKFVVNTDQNQIFYDFYNRPVNYFLDLKFIFIQLCPGWRTTFFIFFWGFYLSNLVGKTREILKNLVRINPEIFKKFSKD